ncbi:AraC family transcriptional regulator [Paenibacillus sp. S150]|uniref:AraC family transcriptional regulator n=1 Tax=Paenibacillus sp. S150 TaxID=2749826 RepID=UPI001C5A30B7|nr:AraC family transcriptional regulator [Paenibacillus sp. S150]MBW4085416.1 AraC family transcriptional regulator [Paenibacillus sp. S150]
MPLPFRLSSDALNPRLPLALYNIGCHAQHPISRPSGYLVPQCFIVFAGKGRVRFKDGRSLTLEAGQAMILPTGQPHEYYPLPGAPWLVGYIGFKGRIAEELVIGCGLPFGAAVSLKNTQSLMNPLRLLWELADQAEPSQAPYISGRLYEFILLLSDLADLPAAPVSLPGSSPAEEALRRAAGYMQEHLTETLQMSNIAHVVGYSVQHFMRLFREAYGITPHAYLQGLRLNQAVKWLEEHRDMPVKEIAGRLGLEPNYFIRAFKKAYGTSPGAYREKLWSTARF